ncbi:hypothetical protein [Streptomyces tritici]|uniref:hypothetical protein n=1 Tax=Streptomyces tritici TaxID=2054410 RepID=UPI003AF001F3
MSMPERETRETVPGGAVLNMRDLLASCAAADAVSTPPRDREPEHPEEARPAVRDAA